MKLYDILRAFGLTLSKYVGGHGWSITFVNHGTLPGAVYACGFCKVTTYFDLNGDGSVPDAKCCTSRIPYPTDIEEFEKHLHLKRTWRDPLLEGKEVVMRSEYHDAVALSSQPSRLEIQTPRQSVVASLGHAAKWIVGLGPRP